MSSRYVRDIDVLPDQLAMACRKALGWRYAIVSFRVDGPLGKTEQKIGGLAMQVRTHLTLTRAPKRTVYFGGERLRHPRAKPRMEAALRLLAAGHTTQAVADALGVSRTTVNGWAPAARPRGVPGHVQPVDDEAVLRQGLGALAKRLRGAPAELTLVELARRLKVPVDKAKHRALCAGWAARALQANYPV